MNDKHEAEQITEALEAVSVIPYPALGIDLDGPLDDHAIFFRLIAHHWPGKVIGFSTVSVRGTEMLVEQLKLHCDDVIVAESAEAKAAAIARSGVLAVISHDFSVAIEIPADRARLWLVT